MQHFEDAITKPFGHLVLDLKPTTPEKYRLRINIFNVPEESRSEITTNDACADKMSHSYKDPQTEQTHSRLIPKNTSTEFENMEQERSKAQSCDECGIVFETQ